MNTILSKSIDTGFEGRLTASARPAAEASGRAGIVTLLRVTYGIVPIVAGVDKFTNFLVHWDIYLNPALARLVPINAHLLMSIVGIVEVVAGILVLARPRIGAFVVTAWLCLIALSLIAGGHYLDVAVRDLVMAVGAFALGSLSGVTGSEGSHGR